LYFAPLRSGWGELGKGLSVGRDLLLAQYGPFVEHRKVFELVVSPRES